MRLLFAAVLLIPTTASAVTPAQVAVAKLAAEIERQQMAIERTGALVNEGHKDDAKGEADTARTNCTDPESLYYGDLNYVGGTGQTTIGDDATDRVLPDLGAHANRAQSDQEYQAALAADAAGNLVAALAGYEAAETRAQFATADYVAAKNAYFTAAVKYNDAMLWYEAGSMGGLP